VRTATLALALVILALACSTKQIRVSPVADLRTVNSAIELEINGDGVDPAVINGLKRHLMATESVNVGTPPAGWRRPRWRSLECEPTRLLISAESPAASPAQYDLGQLRDCRA
jgi:hypothetical protein